jgi:parallel beta-helix repeat protein
MRKCIDGRFALGFSFPLVAGLTVSSAIGFSRPAIAADSPPTALKPIAQLSDTEVTRLYVNPVSGNDDRSSGNALSPLRTITYALEIAPPNTVILLAPGTYNSHSGESFPLRLKPGVTIQGNPDTRGDGIVISGGGMIDRLNVTLVAADRSGLVGVTVTNPEGYGLWIDSASPSILSNTLTGNRQDGIAIGGSGSPIVRGNRLIDNHASGIGVAGTSRADIRENTVEGGDVGLAIAENALPLVMSNEIADNADGVVIRQNAQPILRGNVITENDRYGVVIRDRAQPDLGTADDPGGNTIRDNDENDIENAAQQVVQAFGNQLEDDRIHGQVDFSGGAQPVLVSATRSPSHPTPTVPVRDFGQVLSTRPVIAPRSIALPTASETTETHRASSESPLPKLPTSLAALPSVSPFSPPPAMSPEQPLSGTERVPSLGVLPVPDVDIPLGDAGDESFIALQPPSEMSQPNRIAANLRYRVIVEAHSVRERAAIRAIAPDAFSTFINGEEVVQAGAFRELDRAESLVEQLQGLGLPATIEDMDTLSNN